MTEHNDVEWEARKRDLIKAFEALPHPATVSDSKFNEKVTDILGKLVTLREYVVYVEANSGPPGRTLRVVKD